MPEPDYIDISNRFLQLEVENGFFDARIRGIPIWERVRFHVHRAVLRETGAIGQMHTENTSESRLDLYVKNAKSLLRSLFRKNPFRSSQHDVFVWGHQRRKQLSDGYWWDLFFDPLYESTDLDYLHVEKGHYWDHRTPQKTKNLRYIEFVKRSSLLLDAVGLTNPITTDELRPINAIREDIKAEFGVEIDLKDRIATDLRLRKFELPMYKRLLRRVDPEVVLLAVSFSKETFIEACKSLDIPVVEFQHGHQHHHHLGYSYPGDRPKLTFPDFIFTFGDLWKKTVEYPISDDRVIPVGYPYLERRYEQLKDLEERDQVVFISQGIIGEELSRMAVEVTEDDRIPQRIVYKLHPGEYDRWREEYPWLEDADVTVVDDDNPPLYQLFAESTIQVGVGSTAVYEGLKFGLATYIVDLPWRHYLQALVDEGHATIATSADDLAEKIADEAQEPAASDDIFATNSIDIIVEQLDAIAPNGLDVTVYPV